VKTWFVRLAFVLALLLSAGLIAISFTRLAPMDPTEVLGFVTGGWCVWLTVKQNIWNWPIGIANDVFYIVVFMQARLFADTALQVVYVALGVLGWYWWLHGGANRTTLIVSRISRRTALELLGITVVATAGMTVLLVQIADAAPFLDALTTVTSLVAQYMLTRKLLENWHVWIATDLVYIGLILTSVLYLIFMVMCVVGLVEWRRSLGAVRRQASSPIAETAALV
jgi:nicotinamide mononucleotide transporter